LCKFAAFGPIVSVARAAAKSRKHLRPQYSADELTQLKPDRRWFMRPFGTTTVSHELFQTGARPSKLVDTSTNRSILEAFAVHLLGLYLLICRIDEFVVLPEAVLLASEINAFPDEVLSVNIQLRGK
jgi:hypothetical protein